MVVPVFSGPVREDHTLLCCAFESDCQGIYPDGTICTDGQCN
ncbi:MAG: hypothetical protein ABIK09_20255 [Pseudomonadota bacterium]